MNSSSWIDDIFRFGNAVNGVCHQLHAAKIMQEPISCKLAASSWLGISSDGNKRHFSISNVVKSISRRENRRNSPTIPYNPLQSSRARHLAIIHRSETEEMAAEENWSAQDLQDLAHDYVTLPNANWFAKLISFHFEIFQSFFCHFSKSLFKITLVIFSIIFQSFLSHFESFFQSFSWKVHNRQNQSNNQCNFKFVVSDLEWTGGKFDMSTEWSGWKMLSFQQNVGWIKSHFNLISL